MTYFYCTFRCAGNNREKTDLLNRMDLFLLLTTSLIAIVLVGFGIREDLGSIVAGLIVPLIVIIYTITRFLTKTRQTKRLYKHLYLECGLLEKFSNLHEAASDMKYEFNKSKCSKFLLQIGRYEFGGGVASMFYQLARQKSTNDAKIFVLHASQSSPYLSEERAKFLKKDRKAWIENIQILKRQLDLLKNCGVKLELREHKEPYLWRLFIMDNVAYVSGYFFVTKNDERATVYKFKDHDNSLFKIFDKYFDILWQTYNPAQLQYGSK